MDVCTSSRVEMQHGPAAVVGKRSERYPCATDQQPAKPTPFIDRACPPPTPRPPHIPFAQRYSASAGCKIAHYRDGHGAGVLQQSLCKVTSRSILTDLRPARADSAGAKQILLQPRPSGAYHIHIHSAAGPQSAQRWATMQPRAGSMWTKQTKSSRASASSPAAAPRTRTRSSCWSARPRSSSWRSHVSLCFDRAHNMSAAPRDGRHDACCCNAIKHER